MKKLVDDGQELTISGIVKPNSNKGGALRKGIAYTPALTYQIIEEASASPIVKAQRAKPDVDVFTGKTFKDWQTTKRASPVASTCPPSLQSTNLNSLRLSRSTPIRCR